MSTKERILEEALTLFSEKGYDGTGVDAIAESVGIKGPSLYKHFKGKEEILNVLIDRADERYDEFFGSRNNIGTLPKNREDFIIITMKRISFTMKDPMIRKMRKLLVKEQFRNEKLAKITSMHQMDGLVAMYEKIIGMMIEMGICKEYDPAILAIEIAMPVTVMIAKADRQPELEEEMLKLIEKHLRHFCDVYMRD